MHLPARLSSPRPSPVSPVRFSRRPKPGLIFWGFLLLLTVALGGGVLRAEDAAEKKKDAKEEQAASAEKKAPAEITEAVTIVSETPKEMPMATVSVMPAEQIEAADFRDLSEALNYNAGTYVTVGNKNEYNIKVRGLDNTRTTLLLDGVPVYEPYYNSYDLKTFTAGDIERIQIVKGASSILYGPNTLGGIVEVITRRPDPPAFSAELARGENDDTRVLANGSVALKNFIFLVGFDKEKTSGFNYREGDSTTLRTNSDSDRTNFLGKIYYYPRPDVELLAEYSYYTTNYGLPWALSIQKPNYWRFKDWDRTTLSFGGTTPSFNNGFLKFKAYYVSYFNVLDAYKSATMQQRQWESTYDNYSWGFFALNTTPLGSRHELRSSVNFRNDQVRSQSDVGKPWKDYNQKVFSVGVEDYYRISDHWGIEGGASIDYLMKEDEEGNNKTRVNPLIALKYNPTNNWNLYASLSRKSRFPSMKNLYSSTGGNPDLRDESGLNVEFGAAWQGPLRLSGAVFYNRLKDLIDKLNLSDGTYININVGKASIAGGEVEATYSWKWVDVSANYTCLDAENLSANRPLDQNPRHQFNFFVTLSPRDLFQFNFYGLAVSSCRWTASNNAPYEVPGYAVFNASLEKRLGANLALVCKLENMFDKAYWTEPGYPMRARTFTAGIRFDVGGAARKSE